MNENQENMLKRISVAVVCTIAVAGVFITGLVLYRESGKHKKTPPPELPKPSTPPEPGEPVPFNIWDYASPWTMQDLTDGVRSISEHQEFGIESRTTNENGGVLTHVNADSATRQEKALLHSTLARFNFDARKAGISIASVEVLTNYFRGLVWGYGRFMGTVYKEGYRTVDGPIRVLHPVTIRHEWQSNRYGYGESYDLLVIEFDQPVFEVVTNYTFINGKTVTLP